ncbi:MAG TPA: hypothetical protein VFM68_01025 [Candidatus Saccharimonadales bacterium]|nr:hypothetical protein [Candidatus Saccharimonadales bacterium]
MKTHISALRAVTAMYVHTLLSPIIKWGSGIAAGLLIGIGLLMYFFSPWWGLLAVPVLTIATIGLVVWLLVRAALKHVSPQLNKPQTDATKQFVAKTQRVAETVQTPYFVILFYIVKDLVTGRSKGYIYEVVQDSKTLRGDFEELRKLF